MSRAMRIYYFAVLGAIGGLLAWQVSNYMGLSFFGNLYLSELGVGALIGFLIGGCIGLTDGLVNGNYRQMWQAGLASGLLGMAGGAVGLPLAEAAFQFTGGMLISRMIGWGIFGLAVGFAGGIKGGAQAWKSALGGLAGGAFGVLMLEGFRALVKSPLYGKGAGLLVLGAGIGACIALFTYLLTQAWFEVTSGKMQGTEFILDKFLKKGGPAAFIGSSPMKSDIVLPDPDIAPQHAILRGADTYFVLKDLSLGGTFIDGRKIEEAQLRNGQTISLGHTRVVYREKRG
jgi:hypothetical protein